MSIRKIIGRSYEDYVSLHKALRHMHGDKAIENISVLEQVTDGAGTVVEVAEVDGETIAECTKTPEAWILVCDTNDNAYDGAHVTVTYKSIDGQLHSSSAFFNTSDTTTEVAFDPPINDGAVPVSAVCSIEVQAGDNVYVGVTGCRLNDANRRITIKAGATEALDEDMVGIGSIEIAQATDQHGTDGAREIRGEYVTAWGEIKTFACQTDASDTTTAAIPIDNEGKIVKDFWRIRDLRFEIEAADAIHLRRLTILGAAAIYALIDDGASLSKHSRFGASANCYLGDAEVYYPDFADLITLTITFTPYGKSVAEVIKKSFLVGGVVPIAERIAVGTDVKFEVNDGGGAGGTANVIIRTIDVV